MQNQPGSGDSSPAGGSISKKSHCNEAQENAAKRGDLAQAWHKRSPYVAEIFLTLHALERLELEQLNDESNVPGPATARIPQESDSEHPKTTKDAQEGRQ
jgi:hypothetical protein